MATTISFVGKVGNQPTAYFKTVNYFEMGKLLDLEQIGSWRNVTSNFIEKRKEGMRD